MAPNRDADFSRQVLRDLYSYPRKRRLVAWLLWVFLGWAGAHRFYLGREFTGLAMLFTGGGVLLWWGVDAFLVDRMILSYNSDQALRKAEGRPPRGLDGMPRVDGVDLGGDPDWVVEWRGRSRMRRGLRMTGDLLVLTVLAMGLGGLVGDANGALEAGVAVLLLVALTAMGSGPDWFDELPGLRGMHQWTHQLRLFYRHNPPGSPLLLLFRPVTAFLTAPFRSRARSEVRLYVELGAIFTAFFLLLEVVPGLLIPAILPGRSVQLAGFLTGWAGEVIMTFFFVYGFTAPVGAILTRHLLLERTHGVPRILCALTAVMFFAGWWG